MLLASFLLLLVFSLFQSFGLRAVPRAFIRFFLLPAFEFFFASAAVNRGPSLSKNMCWSLDILSDAYLGTAYDREVGYRHNSVCCPCMVLSEAKLHLCHMSKIALFCSCFRGKPFNARQKPLQTTTELNLDHFLLQFSRNAFRGTPEAFAYDEKACELSRRYSLVFDLHLLSLRRTHAHDRVRVSLHELARTHACVRVHAHFHAVTVNLSLRCVNESLCILQAFISFEDENLIS